MKKTIIICLAIILANAAIYLQTGDFGFTNWDDNEYVSQNPVVNLGLTKESVGWAFDSSGGQFYWQPLTWLSHMLDVKLFGLDGGAHHLINLLYHTLNSLLLFTILAWLTGSLWRSGFVAILFAVHPLNVESVAWIAERKNVLSTFFWLLTICTYIRYAASPSLTNYLLTTMIFMLGLLAKPMLVTIPFVLLLIDFWPLNRLNLGQRDKYSGKIAARPANPSRLIFEKIPFLVLSLAVVIIVSNSATKIPFDVIPLDLRLANAVTLYWHYLSKMVMPVNLAMYYPYPNEIETWPTIGAAFWLLCTSAVILRFYKNRPYLLMGWLWYLATLLPVLGIIQAGFWPKVADRWAYIPLIGLFIIIAWGIPEILAKYRYKNSLMGIASGIIITVMAGSALQQTKYWRDDITLYTHALQVGSNHPLIFNNIGAALKEQGRNSEAITYFQAALELSQEYESAHNNLGVSLAELGKLDEAVYHFRVAISIDPGYADAKNNLAKILNQKEKLERQAETYLTQLKETPDSADLYNKLGATYVRSGLIEEAVESYAAALEKDPSHIKSYNDLGIVLLREGYIEEAITLFKRALKIDPEYEPVRESLKIALKELPRKKRIIN